MSAGDLVCAHCSGLVIEGRCPVCRAARDQLRPELPTWLVVAFVLGVAAALLLVLHSG